MTRRIVLPLLLLTLAAACSSSPSKPGPREESGSRGTGPLGIGYPDPEAVLEQIRDRMDERDFEGLCGLLAGPGLKGKPVPLVPGKNVPHPPKETSKIWVPERFLGPSGGLMDNPWVRKISYGKPRVVTNDPPFYAVPVIAEMDYKGIPEKEREMLVQAARKQHTALDWDEIVAQGKAKEKRMLAGQEDPPELGFVFIERWRFYADAPPKKP